jgi:hypothetical protein
MDCLDHISIPTKRRDFLLPTLLELTGCKRLPKQTQDGKSLASLIRGEKKTLNRPFLAWWFPHPHEGHGRQPYQLISQDG